MNRLASFSEFALTREELKKVQGAWYYGFSCTCGNSGFTGQGDKSDYKFYVSQNCSSSDPVSCRFQEL